MYTEINVNLRKKENFYSKFSKYKLSKEIFDYIYDECYGEDYRNKIKINIYTKEELTDEEKHDMMDIIRRTFGLRVQDELIYYEKEKDTKAIMFLVGIVLIILNYLTNLNLLKQIIFILGWLAIYESSLGILVEGKKNYIRIHRLKQLANARIYYYTGEEGEENKKDEEEK